MSRTPQESDISLIPHTKVYNIPRNISVPSTAFNNTQGSYQISSIPFLGGTQFLLAMSDASGFGTGGISNLLTVGAPVGSASCNTSNPSLPFSFSLPSSLQQCKYVENLTPSIRETHLAGISPYTFDDYDGAVLPITITVSPVGHSILPLFISLLHIGTHSWWRILPPTPSCNGNELYMGRRRCSWNYNYFHADRCSW